MGKVNQGILDGFSGKVGTVVGYFRHGVPIMRAYVRNKSKHQTIAQLRIQLRWKELAGKLYAAFAPAVRSGLAMAAKSKKMNPMAVFMEMNLQAVTANPGLTTIVDYSKMILAKGTLPPVLFGRPDLTVPQTVSATFAPMLQVEETSGQDQVFLFVYCPSLGMGVMSAPAERSTGRVSATIPEQWNGLEVHVWGFTLGNAPINMGRPSNSTYLGSGEIG